MSVVNEGSLTSEDRVFIAKIKDIAQIVRKNNISKFTSFLNERQKALFEMAFYHVNEPLFIFEGGYKDAQRVQACIMADYENAEDVVFPLTAITITYRKLDKLSHRDFLGAFMSLMITRESIGDIIIGEGYAVVFVQSSIAPIIIDEVTKIGRIGVSTELGVQRELVLNHSFEEIKDTVSSLRLDCVVAVGFNLSREKAAALIKGSKIILNGMCIENTSHIVRENDKISAKGYGKFILDSIGGQSKKGKTYIMIKKFI